MRLILSGVWYTFDIGLFKNGFILTDGWTDVHRYKCQLLKLAALSYILKNFKRLIKIKSKIIFLFRRKYQIITHDVFVAYHSSLRMVVHSHPMLSWYLLVQMVLLSWQNPEVDLYKTKITVMLKIVTSGCVGGYLSKKAKILEN